MNSHPLPYAKAIEKAEKYCAVQERSAKQVKVWLKKWLVKREDIQKILEHLKDENFLNEERFARAYARGKFNINGWGRIKIRINLRMQEIREDDVIKGLEEIQEEAYTRKLDAIVARKYASIVSKEDRYMAQAKTVAYAWTKGYEPELITEAIQRVINK
jgi:regulatory protein